MERKNTTKAKELFSALTRVMSNYSRAGLSRLMGRQYDGDRRIYEALGYPDDDKDLNFDYYLAKYERQDIASAIIDRPVDLTWNGQIKVLEPDAQEEDSPLLKAWNGLDERLKIKQHLTQLDKLTGLGEYAVLLYGFSDVKTSEDFIQKAGGESLKLLYIKCFGQNSATIQEWEDNSANERYGKPRIYKITISQPGNAGNTQDVLVHHSRILHTNEYSVISDMYGRPRLKPITNRLVDLEKLLGGSAEMYWRGARPGYHAKSQPDYEMSATELEALEDELTKYEHDLRRFISAQGVDIESLQSQISDPMSHIDAQLQAISAQTGIPKRVLVGSERGELSSTQDRGQWLSLVKTRMEEFAEPVILRPFISTCMEHNILPKIKDFNILWEDLFAPSEKEKVEVGKLRADALKIYSDAVGAMEILPPQLATKYLFGFSEEQVEEIRQAVEEQVLEDEATRATAEEEEIIRQEEETRRAQEEIEV